MSNIHEQYVGAAAEGSYGAGAAPTNFYEFTEEGIAGVYERIESEAIRAGSPFLHADRFQPNPKGAEGDLTLEVVDAGFEFWLKQMLGQVVDNTGTTGEHLAEVADLLGLSFAVQVGRVDNAGVLHPFDYKGGKVATWEMSNSVDGILNLTLSCDFASEDYQGAVAASPTFPAGSQFFSFVGGSVAIGGTDFAVSEVTLGGENGLKTDRYALRGADSTTKREPLVEALRTVTFTLTGEFEGTTHYDRVAAASAAGALADLSLSWSTPRGGSLVVTVPAGRFDEGPVNASGREVVTQELTGKGLMPTDGSSPISVAYTPGA